MTIKQAPERCFWVKSFITVIILTSALAVSPLRAEVTDEDVAKLLASVSSRDYWKQSDALIELENLLRLSEEVVGTSPSAKAKLAWGLNKPGKMRIWPHRQAFIKALDAIITSSAYPALTYSAALAMAQLGTLDAATDRHLATWIFLYFSNVFSNVFSNADANLEFRELLAETTGEVVADHQSHLIQLFRDHVRSPESRFDVYALASMVSESRLQNMYESPYRERFWVWYDWLQNQGTGAQKRHPASFPESCKVVVLTIKSGSPTPYKQ